ncbi:hypothetical protein CVD28_15215 [Bacillus sp. M6-12]|uniref:hypothetical protein n=1 Tax=Bacillus sp. M6-12 TaxID=2054166 RepID=UPI000C790449|nr:hypothetical protein [Bacillus sp. M6-12]PLS16441.1 hypothetical protein CVD28_15215 [Bacillus sp. M6-12]
MVLSIVIGFILPCLVGVYLFIKNPKLMILFVPVGIATSFLINGIGFTYFWKLNHTYKEMFLAAMPFNLGLFPVLGCLFVASIQYNKVNKWWAFLLFTIVTTLFELFAVIRDQVTYRNGWNIFWTGISYLVAYIIAYTYYKIARRYNLI